MTELIPILAAHVLPEFEDYAGARSAGVDQFLLAQLSSEGGAQLKKVCSEINSILQQASPQGQSFSSLSSDERESLLETLALGGPEQEPNSRFADLWRKFIQHCLDGYLCDPRWGGNAEAKGWRSVGLNGPQPPQGML